MVNYDTLDLRFRKACAPRDSADKPTKHAESEVLCHESEQPIGMEVDIPDILNGRRSYPRFLGAVHFLCDGLASRAPQNEKTLQSHSCGTQGRKISLWCPPLK